MDKLRPSEALARSRGKVLAILAEAGVENPRVFGSTARGEDTVESDLDLLVDMSRPMGLMKLAGIEIALEDALGCEVQMTLADGLRPAFANRIAEDLRPL